MNLRLVVPSVLFLPRLFTVYSSSYFEFLFLGDTLPAVRQLIYFLVYNRKQSISSGLTCTIYYFKLIYLANAKADIVDNLISRVQRTWPAAKFIYVTFSLNLLLWEIFTLVLLRKLINNIQDNVTPTNKGSEFIL